MKNNLPCILLLASFICCAAPMQEDDKDVRETQRFPSGCYQKGYSFNYNVLQFDVGEKDIMQSMYFVHNLSKQTVNLYQMRTGEEPFVVHINNSITAKRWAVFATDEKLSRFICTIPSNKSTYGKIINCGDVLDVCQYSNVVFAPNGHGNYWAVTNLGMRAAQSSVIQQGTLLKN
ncbi:MAG: hypothetical protein M3R00_05945 [Pseudomonadota bacterium]|nr:hypothetical protein [Pseudomonadota bacterium]